MMNIDPPTAGRPVSRRILATAAVIPALLLLASGPSNAWNGPGHRTVGLIAYDLLNAGTRSEAVELLRQHERFNQDFWRKMPRSVRKGSKSVQDRWIFMHAATWPDMARKRGTKFQVRWHYINEPIYLNDNVEELLGYDDPATLAKVVNLEQTLPQPPCEDLTKANCKSMNVIQALKFSISMVNSAQTSPADKSLYLCWLIHLVGDIHQPLHSAALFSETFSRGDEGGNRIKVGHTFLHGLWDGLLGKRQRSLASVDLLMDGLLDPDRRAAGQAAAQDLMFNSWFEESYAAARDQAYDPTIMAAVETFESKKKDNKWYRRMNKVKVPVTLPDNYEDEARTVAQRRVVEAGYRLAGLVERLKL